MTFITARSKSTPAGFMLAPISIAIVLISLWAGAPAVADVSEEGGEQPKGDPLEPGTYRPGSPHVAFIVADLDRAWAALQADRVAWGLKFVSDGPVIVYHGPNAGGKAIYCRDPDGITIELVELIRG